VGRTARKGRTAQQTKMKTFKDNAGKTWNIQVNVDAVKRVRSLLDVDLMNAVEGELLQQIGNDPCLLCDIIFCICKPQADAEGVSDVDFGQAMAGDCIEHATDAFLEELINFFPLAKRRLLMKVQEKTNLLIQKVMDLAEEKLDDPKLEEMMEAALRDAGNSFGNLQGQSGSTPDRSPSEN